MLTFFICRKLILTWFKSCSVNTNNVRTSFWTLTVCTFDRFVVSFIYYGLTTNVGSLGGNMYENFALLVLMELAGTSVIFFLNITGRRPVHLVSIFGCGIASIGSIILIQFAEHCESNCIIFHILFLLVLFCFGFLNF